MFTLKIVFILLIFAAYLHAEPICVQIVEGEKVYTNLCGKKSKKEVSKKISSTVINPTSNSNNYARPELEKIVEEKSNLYGVSPKLIKEMIRQESGWNVYAVSPKGAMGIMQLMPSTAMLMGVKNPFDPVENIDGGIRYMRYLLDRFNGDMSLALAAYNAGPNLVASLGRIPNIAETINYVNSISARYYGTNYVYSKQKTYSAIKSSPIKAVKLADGSILYTNRGDFYLWTKEY